MRKLTLICIMCMLMVLSTMVVACDNNQEQDPSTHDHTYSSEWSKDETHHWHEATCEHTDLVKDKAEHSYGEDNKCVCGKEKNEQQPGDSGTHSHTYSEEWTHDDTYHWHAATCEHTDLVKDRVEHNYGADNKCVCGKEKSEQQPGDSGTHSHTYSDKWTHDDTYHWHKATCEHEDEVSDKAEHSYGADNKCTECNYQE